MTSKQQAIAISSALSALLLASAVHAQGIPNPLGGVNSFSDLFGNLANGVKLLIGPLATIMVIIAGIYFIIPGKEGEAKSTLLYAVVGLAVGLAVTDIVSLAQSASTGGTPAQVLTNIAGTVGKIVIAMGTIMVTVAGLMFLLSAGNEKRAENAKHIMTYAIIGIVVGLLATSIVALVDQWF